MTHIPAALQHCLAWQSALLFDWDGEQALNPTSRQSMVATAQQTCCSQSPHILLGLQRLV